MIEAMTTPTPIDIYYVKLIFTLDNISNNVDNSCSNIHISIFVISLSLVWSKAMMDSMVIIELEMVKDGMFVRME